MSENNPPADNAQASSSDASRGMPYYEQLRKNLRETLQSKRALDQQMLQLEDHIYKLETAYLEETSAGNIIKGFDNYIKGSTSTSASGNPRRKAQINDADRIFSKSSSSSFLRDSEPPTSAHTTPSHAATPTSSFPSKDTSLAPSASGNGNGHKTKDKDRKKRADKDRDDDEDGGKPVKRNYDTFDDLDIPTDLIFYIDPELEKQLG